MKFKSQIKKPDPSAKMKKWVKFKNIKNIKSKVTFLGNGHKNFSWRLIS